MKHSTEANTTVKYIPFKIHFLFILAVFYKSFKMQYIFPFTYSKKILLNSEFKSTVILVNIMQVLCKNGGVLGAPYILLQ